MEMRLENKILSLKEEADSSHVNQAYDKYVAKGDKSAKSECLALLRNRKISRGVVDQWRMLHVGLYAVRDTDPGCCWTTSFGACCNLDPRSRLPFPLWCKKIEGFLQGGESFKPESFDIYLLLPTLWCGMLPDEKKEVVATVKKC
jgi:hypothetical protein